MRAHTSDAVIAQNFPELGWLVLGKIAETRIRISHRRAKLHGFKSSVFERLYRAREFVRDHFPHRPRLTANWQAQGISAKLPCAREQEPRDCGIRRHVLKKLPSRIRRHSNLMHWIRFGHVQPACGILSHAPGPSLLAADYSPLSHS